MTVPNGWQGEYGQLCDFIAASPSIEIGMNIVRIPEDVRPEFYRLFDTIRLAFVEEKFPGLLNEAGSLSQSYNKAEQEVTELLGLDSISMATDLRKFLHNPKDGMVRGLFDPLFHLLKGKVNIEAFEQKTSRNTEVIFRNLYQLGYEKWVLLSLIKLLEADKSFRIILRELASKEVIKRLHSPRLGEPVPPPEESKRLLFEHQSFPMFIVPDFIVHSVKMGRYLAVRSDFREAMWTASNASANREWYPLDSLAALEPGLALVYVADKPEEISLVADAKKICRPDLIIECRDRKDWLEKEGLQKVKLHHDSLKPRLGSYVVSRESVPEQGYKELIPEQNSEESPREKPVLEQEPRKKDIHVLTVGFDQSMLEPVISILMKHENKD